MKNYDLRKEMDDTILDVRDSWVDDDNEEAPEADATLEEKIVLEVPDSLLEDIPTKEEREYLKSGRMLCGAGRHFIPSDIKPLRVRNLKGCSYVCSFNCVKPLPKNVFVKQMKYTARQLRKHRIKNTPLNKFIAVEKKSLEKIVLQNDVVQSASDKVKDVVVGFMARPFGLYYMCAFATAWRRSGEVNNKYSFWQGGFGNWASTTASVLGIGVCFAAMCQDYLESLAPESLLFLVGTNAASYLYEIFRQKKQAAKSFVNDAYDCFYERILSEGFEIGHRELTKKLPYRLAVLLRDDEGNEYTDDLKAVTTCARDVAKTYEKQGITADWTGSKPYDKKKRLIYVGFQES